MTDPLKVIQAAAGRLGRRAAIAALLITLPVAAVMAAVAGWLEPLAAASWQRWGFALDPSVIAQLRYGLIAGAVLAVVIAGLWAYWAASKAGGLERAAEVVDAALGSHQEMVTVAGLSESSVSARSTLFPLLWQRTATAAQRLDVAMAIPLRVARSAMRGGLVAIVTAAVVAIALALVVANLNNPILAQSRELRGLAASLRKPEAGAQSEKLAEELTSAAKALENGTLTPKAKLSQLAAIKSRIEQQQQETASGNASGRDRGTGQGGTGKGSGKNKSGGAQLGEGSGKKGTKQLAEANADLSKAEARIAAENGSKSSSPIPQPGKNGPRPAPGKQNNQTGTRLAVNQPGPAAIKRPQVSEKGSGHPSGKPSGTPRGDTHLGEFPAPRRVQRFYKPGEKGPKLVIKNARYLVFRIPPAAQSGGNGKTVVGGGHPKATVPFRNLPLAQEQIKAEPDQEQLVPPRYRSLLR